MMVKVVNKLKLAERSVSIFYQIGTKYNRRTRQPQYQKHMSNPLKKKRQTFLWKLINVKQDNTGFIKIYSLFPS